MKMSFTPSNAKVSRQTIYEDMFFGRDEDGVMWYRVPSGVEKRAPFGPNEMPDDLCQAYVDKVYGDPELLLCGEECFNDFRFEEATDLRKRIVKYLKTKQER